MPAQGNHKDCPYNTSREKDFMKVTRKSDYGLRALFTLAKFHGEQPVSIGQIAA